MTDDGGTCCADPKIVNERELTRRDCLLRTPIPSRCVNCGASFIGLPRFNSMPAIRDLPDYALEDGVWRRKE